ncbi:MAG TPA: HAMP domain-containing sensor histidine kinase [Saprospiraceae bacterium]|nr:HAMP domain-containing sensor histidine kinase [Saprospiraceae bacterium]
MSHRTIIGILVVVIGYGAIMSLIFDQQSVWILLFAIIAFLLIWLFIWLETRKIRYLLKYYKRKIFEVLRNIQKFEQPKYDHHASKIGMEIEDFYDGIGRQILKTFNIEKQFTQNASHELQTPIMVIKTSIESLLQSPNLSEENYYDLDTILRNTNKLSRINQALVLLSRIKSYHNVNVELTVFNSICDQLLEDLEPRMEFMELSVEKDYQGILKVNMNPTLCEILISNLINNAIKHNKKGGWIKLKITHTQITVSNSGKILLRPANEMFERFAKDESNPESLGLGLSIVKLICDYSNLDIGYYHKEGIHELIITRKN